ncbi:ABC transporter permease [Pelosinus propionicus]|uniref:Transport permease protein n=1 Tax=Pelosinus propionicus DSM 13327 TaxID=1123291 RepID=A0A1I4N5M8_9FIRM|nr:ABC transporter permease [Pelosinus propionicus]SFM10832.1 ABC-type multidrug transport system, permease component [Pelosinus propionicus DSM 13327]
MLYDIWTVFWRDWLVLKRRIGRFILSRMVSPILYLVAFGWGLGRSIQVNQGNYLDFIVPGIIALNSMNISFNSVGSPLNMSRVYHKTLEEYLIAPISSISFVFGKVLSGALRGLLSSLIIILLAFAFGAHALITVWFAVALVLNCLVFASMGLVAAMIMDTHEDMANFNTYVLLPMSFLCATFFIPDHLPAILRWLIEILPLTHASHALRAIVSGGGIPVLSLIIMAAYVTAFCGIGVWLMEKVRE